MREQLGEGASGVVRRTLCIAGEVALKVLAGS